MADKIKYVEAQYVYNLEMLNNIGTHTVNVGKLHANNNIVYCNFVLMHIVIKQINCLHKRGKFQ